MVLSTGCRTRNVRNARVSTLACASSLGGREFARRLAVPEVSLEHFRGKLVLYLASGAGGPKVPVYSLLYVDVKAGGIAWKAFCELDDTAMKEIKNNNEQSAMRMLTKLCFFSSICLEK